MRNCSLLQKGPVKSFQTGLSLLRCFLPLAMVLSSASPALADKLVAGAPEDVGMSGQRLAVLDTLLTGAIANGEVPGAVVLVARSGKIVLEKAYGSRSVLPEPEPMTVDTVFDMASLTKVIATATSVMTLVEKGQLALSDPVVNYLPDFGDYGKDEITVEDLLTHYSGLRPDLDLNEPWEGYETAVALAFEERLVAPPRSRFIYSDINYLILGELVRTISGLPLDEYAAQAIFEPLGMSHTSFNPAEDTSETVAPTEQRDGRMLRGQVHDPTAARMGGVAGHAGLFSRARDVAIFAQMVLNDGSYGDSRILSPLGVRQMVTNHAPAGAVERGYGFDMGSRNSTPRGDLFPVGSFGHTGFTGTSLWIDPATQTLVVLLTSRLHPDGTGDAGSLRKRVASVVASSILDLERPVQHK